MKSYQVKGMALFPVIAGVLIFAGGAVLGAGAMYLYGRMHGGGLGDGSDIGIIQADAPVPETVPEITIETEPEITEPLTEPLTQPATEVIGTVTVTILGNEYYYQENPIELDELTAILHYSEDDELTVKIIKSNASRNASIRLKNALEQENILYIEQTDAVTAELDTSEKLHAPA